MTMATVRFASGDTTNTYIGRNVRCRVHRATSRSSSFDHERGSLPCACAEREGGAYRHPDGVGSPSTRGVDDREWFAASHAIAGLFCEHDPDARIDRVFGALAPGTELEANLRDRARVDRVQIAGARRQDRECGRGLGQTIR